MLATLVFAGLIYLSSSDLCKAVYTRTETISAALWPLDVCFDGTYRILSS